jgi:ABC-type multidrug transport system fused ATPase/permease subunit
MTGKDAEKKESTDPIQNLQERIQALEGHVQSLKNQLEINKKIIKSFLVVAIILLIGVIVLIWALTYRIEMIGLLISFAFILLDYVVFELKMLYASPEKSGSYEPRMKIWGLGVLLGLGFPLLSRWSEIMGALGSGTAGAISKAALTLGIVGLFIYGVTRLTGED